MANLNADVLRRTKREPNIHWLVASAASLHQLKTSNLASVRLRAAVAAQQCLSVGVSCAIGDNELIDPDILIVCKIGADGIDTRSKTWLHLISTAKKNGAKVVLDYTDHHFANVSVMSDFYNRVLEYCDSIVIPSLAMKSNIRNYWAGTTAVIPDAIEYEIQIPRLSQGDRPSALWFGHPTNLEFLVKFIQVGDIAKKLSSLVICTDARGIQWIAANRGYFKSLRIVLVQWSVAVLPKLASQCSFALLPAGKLDPRKSGASENRLITALALGLPVIANSLPAYQPYRAFYSDIDEDDYMSVVTNPEKMHELVRQAQASLIPKFSCKTIGMMWGEFFKNCSSIHAGS